MWWSRRSDEPVFAERVSAARQALDSLPQGPQGVTAIPGNHDVYVWGSVLWAHVRKMLCPYAQSDGATEGELPTWPIVRKRDGVAIVGCSTALPSPVPLADGWLGGKQLQRLEQMLDGLRDHFRVLLIHHPPLPQHLDVLRALRIADGFMCSGASAASLCCTAMNTATFARDPRQAKRFDSGDRRWLRDVQPSAAGRAGSLQRLYD